MSAEEGHGKESLQQHEQQQQPQEQPMKDKPDDDEPMQEAHQNGGEQGQQGGGEQQHAPSDGAQQQEQDQQGARSGQQQMEGVEQQQHEGGEQKQAGEGAQPQQDGAQAGEGTQPQQQQQHQAEGGEQEKKEGEQKQEGKDREEEKEQERGERRKESSRGDKESSRDKERDRDAERKEKDRKREKEKEREKEKDRKRLKEKERERSRERHKSSSRRSRSRSRDRKKSSSRRSRSASRDRRRRRSRSRSRDRKRASSRRSRSRDRRRSSSRDRRRSKARSSSSDSEVGGYKPRRKHTPPSVIGPGTGADPFANMRQMAVPQDPQAQMRMWQLQQLQARHMVLEQQAKSAATATSKTQREVYVGGLTPGVVTAEALRTLFNSALSVQFAHQLMAGMDPVINVNMHPEGKFAFVEFRNPDMATAALALHQQVQLMGCNLAVARPSGYMDPVKASKACNAAKMALSAFERNDMEALKEAVLQGANLHGLGLPEHIVNPHQPVQLPPGVSVDGLSAAPTPDLCFTGMVTAQRLESDSEYKDMIEDLRDQCNEFVADSVVDVKCPRPYDPMLSDQYIGIANYGKIFVKYKDAEAAKVCKDKIHGRLYGGQLVQAYFISEEAFAKAG